MWFVKFMYIPCHMIAGSDFILGTHMDIHQTYHSNLWHKCAVGREYLCLAHNMAMVFGS